MLNTYSEIPFKALIYLTAECYYGGKVTDDWDRRVLNALLTDFYKDDIIIYESYKFCELTEYYIPDDKDIYGTIDFLKDVYIYTYIHIYTYSSLMLIDLNYLDYMKMHPFYLLNMKLVKFLIILLVYP
jgi:hypothetical protein